MSNTEDRIKDWFDIKIRHNSLKNTKDHIITLEEENAIPILIDKLMLKKINEKIAPFPIEERDDMRQEIRIEIFTNLDKLKVLTLGIKENDKIVKVSKREKKFTKEDIEAFSQIETYINNNILEDQAELDNVISLLNEKYSPISFDYIKQTGYSFCMNYVQKIAGIYDAKIKGISRGDRDRINKLKRGISTDKKQSTKDRLMQLEANSVPESLSVYDSYDKDDPISTMLMPKALQIDSAENTYWNQSDDIKESFIEDAIRDIEEHTNNEKISPYSKNRRKMVFLWSLYKKLGYDISLLPDEFIEKAKKAEYKKSVPEGLLKLAKEWDEKLYEFQLAVG